MDASKSNLLARVHHGVDGRRLVAPRPIVALVKDDVERRRLQRSLAGYASLRFCSTRGELFELSRHLLTAVILEPRDAHGAPLAPLVLELRRGIPSLTLLAYVDFTPEQAQDILALARAGIDDLILRGRDDAKSMLSVISRSARRSAASQALSDLTPIVGSTIAPLLAYCLERADEPLSVGNVATALGVHRKTLAQRSVAKFLPPPSVLIVWCRLLVAARLLDDPLRTVQEIAATLRFGSSAALRGVFRRYTGLRPQSLRELGAFHSTLEACKRALGAGNSTHCSDSPTQAFLPLRADDTATNSRQG